MPRRNRLRYLRTIRPPINKRATPLPLLGERKEM